MRYLLAIILLTIVSSLLIAQESSDTIMTVHDMSQTQDDVTITLDQTYADTGQIHAWFTIDGMDLPDGRLMGAPILFISPLLPDYPSIEIGSMSNAVDIDNGMITVFSTFEMSIPADEMLDVVFNVRVEQPEGMPLYLVPDNVPDEESTNPEYAYELPYSLDMLFSVTLNPFQANTILTNFRDESNGMSLSIDEITLTPHSAQIPVCFELPDNGDWQPNIRLEINGEKAQISSFNLNGLPSPTDIERCTTFDFIFSVIDSVESITITIDGYLGNIPDAIDERDIARAQERLQGTGIIVEYGDAGTVTVIDYPDSMLEEDAYAQAFNMLRDRYDGYWEFSLTMDAISFHRAE